MNNNAYASKVHSLIAHITTSSLHLSFTHSLSATLVPTVLSSYPAQKPASPNVALFCFPEDITPDNVNKLRMYVLKRERGRRW